MSKDESRRQRDKTIVGILQSHRAGVTPYNKNYALFFQILAAFGVEIEACQLSSRDLEKYDAILVGTPRDRAHRWQTGRLAKWVRSGGSLLFLDSFWFETGAQRMQRFLQHNYCVDHRTPIEIPDSDSDWDVQQSLNTRIKLDVSSFLGEQSSICYDTGTAGILADDQECTLPELRIELPKDHAGMRLAERDGRIASTASFTSELNLDEMDEEELEALFSNDDDAPELEKLERFRIRNHKRLSPFAKFTVEQGQAIYFGAARSFTNYSLRLDQNAEFLNWLITLWIDRLNELEFARRKSRPQRHRLLHGYPMAPVMHEISSTTEPIGQAMNVEQCVQQQVAESRSLIIGVLPHPFCNPKVDGCGFCTFPNQPFHRAGAERVVQNVIKEIDHVSGKIPSLSNRKIKALYFGGGTANITPVEPFSQLCDKLNESYDLADAEITLEGVPIYFLAKDSAIVHALRDHLSARHYRISMGIQTFDPKMLRQMGRDAYGTRRDIEKIVQLAHQQNMAVSGDMLFNLPGQTLKDMRSDLNKAIDLGLDQICLYHLVMFDGLGTAWSKDAELLAKLPDNSTACDNWLALRERLISAGFVPTTLTNFERKSTNESSRRFQYEELGFDIVNQDILGFGPSGISSFVDFQRLSGLKLHNHEKAPEYQRAIETIGRGWAKQFEFRERDLKILMLTRQIARLEINVGIYKDVFGISPVDDFPREFQMMRAADFLTPSENGYRITPEGSFYADTLAGQLAWKRIKQFGVRKLVQQDATTDTAVFDVHANDAVFSPMG